MNILIQKFDDKIPDPIYATDGSAGFDLVVQNFKTYYDNRNNSQNVNSLNIVQCQEMETVILMNPFSRLLVGCGFALALPEGYELQVRSRSGSSLKEGLIVMNAPGTIDEDYRGEIMVTLCNNSLYPVQVALYDRVAQAILGKYEKAEFIKVDKLPETKRGVGGLGSTGISSKNIGPNSQNLDWIP